MNRIPPSCLEAFPNKPSEHMPDCQEIDIDMNKVHWKRAVFNSFGVEVITIDISEHMIENVKVHEVTPKILMVEYTDAGDASLRDGLDYALSVQLKLDLTPAMATASRAVAQHLAGLPVVAAPPPPLAGGTSIPPPPPAPPTEADVLAPLRASADFSDYARTAKASKPLIAQLVSLKTPLAAPVAVATAAIVASDLSDADAVRAGLTVDGAGGVGVLDVTILDATFAAARGANDPSRVNRLIQLTQSKDSRERARAEAAAELLAALNPAPDAATRARLAAFDLPAGTGPGARLIAMDTAADSARKGETGLLAVWIAEAAGGSGPSLDDRIRIEHALVRVGLGANAQAFAVEGLAQLQAR